MSEQQPRDLGSLFEALVEIESAAERTAFLEKECGDDIDLRKQLERLLLSDRQAGSFLEKPAPGLDATLLHDSPIKDLADVLDSGFSPAFGEHEAVVLGAAGHSVLKSLAETMENLPRVSLRDPTAAFRSTTTGATAPTIPARDLDSRYRIDGEIARGGMGKVLRGRDTDLGRDLAIKVLLDDHKSKPEIVHRFIEEAQIGGQLQHPGIAPVYELGQFADQRPFFSMKLVKGQTLAELLAARQDLAADRSRFLGIFEQVCQTLAYAHSRGVIHRDLKPANIMVGAFGEVQVMDWGLAKVVSNKESTAGGESSTSRPHDTVSTRRSAVDVTADTVTRTAVQTQVGSVMGTPAYMPPEQARGETEHVDERADVFGLGAILCEILTGQPPYVADNATQIYRLATQAELGPCFTRLAACEADNDPVSLAKQCLAPEPDDRPHNATEVATSVSNYLQSVEQRLREAEMARAAEAARVTEERKRRRVQQALAISMLVLVSGMGFVGAWYSKSRAARMARTKYVEGEIRTAMETATSERHRLYEALGNAGEFHKYLSDMRLWRAKLDTAQRAGARAEQLLSEDKEGLLPELLYEQQKSLVKQLKEDETHWQLAQRLDEIRLGGHAPTRTRKGKGQDKGIDFSSNEDLYTAAFRDKLGVELLRGDVQHIVKRLQSLPHYQVLVAALDYWATSTKERVARRLTEIARRIDPHPLRDVLRNPSNWNRRTLVAVATRIKPQQHSPQLLHLLAHRLRRSGANGARLLRSAIIHYPQDFWLHYSLGNMSQDVNERIGCFKAAIAIRPRSVIAHNNWGVAVGKRGDLERASVIFTKTIELDPDHELSHFNLGLAHFKQKAYDKAIESFQAAVKLHPRYVKAILVWGGTLRAKGDLTGAIKQLQRAARELPPNHPYQELLRRDLRETKAELARKRTEK